MSRADNVPAASLQAVLQRWRVVAGFSAAANVLLVVVPVYLLQIYDRGLPRVRAVSRA